MTPARGPRNNTFVARDSRISSRVNIPTVGTIFSIAVILFLVYAFFSGLSFQFYASFLFLFYGITKTMWVSVVMLGIFQTLLMIPFRVIRLLKTNNIREFQRTVERMEDQKQQSFVLKNRFHEGNPTMLFYSVDFVMQLVSYISIGRLFLTDFYAQRISPALLYSWVPEPLYPIRDTFFKIPYPHVTESVDLGWKVIIPVWILLTVLQLGISTALRSMKPQQRKELGGDGNSGWQRYITGYLIFFLAIAYFLLRNFPIHWEMAIFSGDISIPNRTFNTVTAVATFLVLIYHSIPSITRKGRMAEALGVPAKIIETTQLQMFKDSVFSAALIGLGAFFITNQIPSAFELSIFTLEVISLAAPFTLDKVVLKGINLSQAEEDTEEDVLHEFGQPSRPAAAEPEEPADTQQPAAPAHPEDTAEKS